MHCSHCHRCRLLLHSCARLGPSARDSSHLSSCPSLVCEMCRFVIMTVAMSRIICCSLVFCIASQVKLMSLLHVIFILSVSSRPVPSCPSSSSYHPVVLIVSVDHHLIIIIIISSEADPSVCIFTACRANLKSGADRRRRHHFPEKLRESSSPSSSSFSSRHSLCVFSGLLLMKES